MSKREGLKWDGAKAKELLEMKCQQSRTPEVALMEGSSLSVHSTCLNVALLGTANGLVMLVSWPGRSHSGSTLACIHSAVLLVGIANDKWQWVMVESNTLWSAMTRDSSKISSSNSWEVETVNIERIFHGACVGPFWEFSEVPSCILRGVVLEFP